MGVMDDLLAFLKARLDEDEQTARAVDDRSHPWDGQWVADEDGNGLRTYNGHVLVAGYRGPLKRGLVEHMARWDPARVLREVEAKRRTLETHASDTDPCDTYAASMRGIPCDIVLGLASPYSDHPDYREEWRP